MLLTVTTTHRPATDLGHLLRKNPTRAQSFELSFGHAHVFYPEASEDRCTVALLLAPVPEPEWLNRTINIDTGCVFGGKPTALRYPEKELVSVASLRTYCEPARPFLPDPAATALTSQQQLDDLLDMDDVLGKRIISTGLHHNVTIHRPRHGNKVGDGKPEHGEVPRDPPWQSALRSLR